MNICIIPARGGSKRIPGKNTRLFHGKPIIAYAIQTARSSGLFDKIVVSTEDEVVRAVAKAYQAKIHNRAVALADDITGTQEVTKAALNWWCNAPNVTRPEFACCLYPTCPLLTPNDLRVGLQALRHNTAIDYVYAVGPDRVDLGQFYWGRPASFLNGVPLASRSFLVELPLERACDINTEEDWQRAERMYRALQERSAEPGVRDAVL